MDLENKIDTSFNPPSFVSIKKPRIGKISDICITAPPSKSETNRALIIGATAKHPFLIKKPSLSDDSLCLVEAFNAVGIEVEIIPEGFLVKGCYNNTTEETKIVNLKKSGSALRFFLPISIFFNGTTIIDADPQLKNRPINTLIESLRDFGAEIICLEEQGCLPIKVTGKTQIVENHFNVDVSKTSQMLSGLLLAAALLKPLTRIYFNPAQQISQSYTGLTHEMLRSVGVEWQWRTACYELGQNQILSNFLTVGGDWTSASYWLGLAATIPCEITLKNLSFKSMQGDVQQHYIFNQWGIDVIDIDNAVHILNLRGNVVKPFDLDFTNMPDIAQTFAVLAAFANDTSILRGLTSLAYKETNRIEALCTELSQLNQKVKPTNNTLKISPQPIVHMQAIKTYEDHRMAMSFAILANKLDQVEIENPNVIQKSYPNFWEDLQKAGYELDFSE